MVKPLCQICLRSGFERTEDIDEKLIELHDEICDYDAFASPTLSYCPICEYMLRKFYNFKLKCRRAHKILKSKRVASRKKRLENLHELMPPDSITFSTKDRQAVISCVPELAPYITIQNQSGEHILVVFSHNDRPASEAVEHTLGTVEHVSRTVEHISGTVEHVSGTVEHVSGTVEHISGTVEQASGVDSIKVETEVEDPVLVNNTVNTEFKQEPLDLEDNNDCDLNSDCGNDPKLAEFLNTDSDDEKPISKYIKGNLNNDLDTSVEKHMPVSTDTSKRTNLLCKDDSDEEFHSDFDDLEETSVTSNNITLSLTDGMSFKELKLLSKTLTKPDKKVIKIQKRILELKNRTVWLIENGKLDLGDNVTLTKEMFLDMFAKCDKSRLQQRGVLNNGPGGMAKLKKFLLYLLKMFNPVYETVFEIQYLTTRDMKIVEFNSRKKNKEYLTAEFKCERCYKGFELQSLLDYHMKWHEESRPHACDICSMRFEERKHLYTHARSNHDCVYRCKLCSLVTYGFSAMVNHYDQHKGMKYACDICLREYNSKSALNTHMLSHATNECAFCARRFVTQSGLHNHVKMKHQGATLGGCGDSPPAVPCGTCGAVFTSRDVLQRHTRLLHNKMNPALFKCRYTGCSNGFDSAAELRQHVLSAGHEGNRREGRGGGRTCWGAARGGGGREARVNVTGPDKPYRKCPICGEQVASTSRTSLYKHHVSAHPTMPYASSDERNCLCEHCGKTFVHFSIYCDHLNTHSGARPYACSQCGARFAMRRALITHSERHRPPRHECSRCGKKFLTAANLFTHMRSHIGDRRFKCEICLKGFLHAGSLTAHVNGVHNQIRRVKRAARK